MKKIIVYGHGDKTESGFPTKAALEDYLKGELFSEERGRYRYTQNKKADLIVVSRDGLAFGHLEVKSMEPPTTDDYNKYPSVKWVYVISKSVLYTQPVPLKDLDISNIQFGKEISYRQFKEIERLSGGGKEFRSKEVPRHRGVLSLTAMVQEIERRAATREFGRLQEIRKELKGLSRLHRQIFPPQSIFEDGDGGYAFHFGGRKELQFNIGSESEDRRRHGVAYSFEPSRTLPEPELLLPSVSRFNEFLRLHPDQFSDMWMWHWDEKGNRSSDYRPAPIQADLIRRGMFVFLGRMQPTDAIDYNLIMDDLDRLLPLYRFAEGSETFPVTIEPTNGGFQFKPGCSAKPSKANTSVAERQLNINLRHNEIQQALYANLAAQYGADDVGTECSSAGGRVDVVVRRGGKFWFYEIKTAMSARGCIGEALAQLLEYSFWPGAQVAEKLVIVGEPVLEPESECYIAILREQFSLPIEYWQFDFASGTIVSRGNDRVKTAVS